MATNLDTYARLKARAAAIQITPLPPVAPAVAVASVLPPELECDNSLTDAQFLQATEAMRAYTKAAEAEIEATRAIASTAAAAAAAAAVTIDTTAAESADEMPPPAKRPHVQVPESVPVAENYPESVLDIGTSADEVVLASGQAPVAPVAVTPAAAPSGDFSTEEMQMILEARAKRAALQAEEAAKAAAKVAAKSKPTKGGASISTEEQLKELIRTAKADMAAAPPRSPKKAARKRAKPDVEKTPKKRAAGTASVKMQLKRVKPPLPVEMWHEGDRSVLGTYVSDTIDGDTLARRAVYIWPGRRLPLGVDASTALRAEHLFVVTRPDLPWMGDTAMHPQVCGYLYEGEDPVTEFHPVDFATLGDTCVMPNKRPGTVALNMANRFPMDRAGVEPLADGHPVPYLSIVPDALFLRCHAKMLAAKPKSKKPKKPNSSKERTSQPRLLNEVMYGKPTADLFHALFRDGKPAGEQKRRRAHVAHAAPTDKTPPDAASDFEEQYDPETARADSSSGGDDDDESDNSVVVPSDDEEIAAESDEEEDDTRAGGGNAASASEDDESSEEDIPKPPKRKLKRPSIAKQQPPPPPPPTAPVGVPTGPRVPLTTSLSDIRAGVKTSTAAVTATTTTATTATLAKAAASIARRPTEVPPPMVPSSAPPPPAVIKPPTPPPPHGYADAPRPTSGDTDPAMMWQQSHEDDDGFPHKEQLYALPYWINTAARSSARLHKMYEVAVAAGQPPPHVPGPFSAFPNVVHHDQLRDSWTGDLSHVRHAVLGMVRLVVLPMLRELGDPAKLKAAGFQPLTWYDRPKPAAPPPPTVEAESDF